MIKLLPLGNVNLFYHGKSNCIVNIKDPLVLLHSLVGLYEKLMKVGIFSNEGNLWD